MAQESVESRKVPLPRRTTPIQDEVLKSCLLQVNLGERNSKPHPAFEVYSPEQIREWAKVGVTWASNSNYQKQIPNWFARKALAMSV